MTGREKSLIAIFILALVGWLAFHFDTRVGIKFSIDATAVAIRSYGSSSCIRRYQMGRYA